MTSWIEIACVRHTPPICSAADPEAHPASPRRLSLSGWQNAVRLPYAWDNAALFNWCISAWALKLTKEQGNSTVVVRTTLGQGGGGGYVGNFWQEFLMRGESSYGCSRAICVYFLRGFIVSVQRHSERQDPRCVLHPGADALKYATDTMNEQTKSIIINIPKSVNLLKQRYRNTASYASTRVTFPHWTQSPSLQLLTPL